MIAPPRITPVAPFILFLPIPRTADSGNNLDQLPRDNRHD